MLPHIFAALRRAGMPATVLRLVLEWFAVVHNTRWQGIYHLPLYFVNKGELRVYSKTPDSTSLRINGRIRRLRFNKNALTNSGWGCTGLDVGSLVSITKDKPVHLRFISS